MTADLQTPAPERVIPPGPRPIFPGQHLLALLRDPIGLLMDAARYGDVVKIQAGRQGTYLFTGPEDIRDVLITHHRSFTKSPLLRRMSVLLGQGLLTSEGDFWLRQRRLIQPAFHRQRIAAYGRIMADYARKTSATWRDGEMRDIHHEMMRLTMMVVGHALFGTDVEHETGEIGQDITTLLNGSRRLRLPFYQKIQALPLRSNQAINEAGQRLDARIREMIAERRAALERGDAPSGDLLDMLLLARDEAGDGQGMSDQVVRDEALTLFLAGHETTANALTWTWYLLSQHPQVEARLHEELDRVLGGRDPGAEDAERLPYTRQVLAESLRLYPPSWLISRQAQVDYQVGRYLLPAGSVILMSQWVSHHDARFYPDPFRFDPERWTPEAVARRPRFSYFPFGGGPRLCVGEPFAWMEGTLVLATLAQRWQLRLDPGQSVELLPQVTLRPKSGMRMSIHARQPRPAAPARDPLMTVHHSP